MIPSGGTAIPANVATGTTFFGASQTNWTLQTGTFDPWSPQWLQTKDDWVSSGGTSSEYIAEEAIQEAPSGNPFSGYNSINFVTDSSSNNRVLQLYSGAVKQDTRTGLWWSDVAASSTSIALGTITNSFSISGDGSRPTSTLGNAMGFCNALNLYNAGAGFAGHNDWYLPTQKQLMQAYIDGAANNLSKPNLNFWSATEYYNITANAWLVTLYYGFTNYTTKVTGNNVRCVRP